MDLIRGYFFIELIRGNFFGDLIRGNFFIEFCARKFLYRVVSQNSDGLHFVKLLSMKFQAGPGDDFAENSKQRPVIPGTGKPLQALDCS